MILEVRAVLQKIMPGKAIATGYVCELILFREAETNGYGEKKGKDQYYPVTMFAASYADVQEKVGELIGKKVVAECYLNGKEFNGRDGLMYTVNLTLKNVSRLEVAEG